MPTRPAALALLACLPLAATAQAMQTVPITDVGGFAQPVKAATAEIPAGWRSQGGVFWHHATNCVSNKVRFEWQARSRDDLQGFEIMPGYSWQVRGTQIQMNPCPVQGFRSARDFLEAVVQQRRGAVQILQYRGRPDLAAARSAQAGPLAHPAMRRRVDAGQLLIAYRDGDVDVREVFGSTIEFTELQGNIVGGASMVFAHRAPHGQLDFALSDRLAASVRYERAWGEQMIAALRSSEQRFSSGQRNAIASWHAREMARINAEGAADRAAIRANTNREIAQIRADTYAGTQASNDRIHRRNLEGIGEYNSYRDGDRTVRSSIHGGARVLRNPDGSYMSTDDPYFNPAGSRELQRQR